MHLLVKYKSRRLSADATPMKDEITWIAVANIVWYHILFKYVFMSLWGMCFHFQAAF